MRQPTDSVSDTTSETDAGWVAEGDVGPDITSWSAYLAELADAPWEHDFFATLRRLENLRPDLPRWGMAVVPQQESVRIGQEPTLAFAPSTFTALQPATDVGPPRLRQAFLGYIGPNGPLPVHLSDFVRERVLQGGDHTLLHFLDQFAHRFALHFYRAWAQARPTVGLDRPGEDDFRRRLGSFAGASTPGRQQRDSFHDDARVFFSGWMLRQVRNQESVESTLGAYFGIPVQVVPWDGHWEVLEPADCTRLGGRARLLCPAAWVGFEGRLQSVGSKGGGRG